MDFTKWFFWAMIGMFSNFSRSTWNAGRVLWGLGCIQTHLSMSQTKSVWGRDQDYRMDMATCGHLVHRMVSNMKSWKMTLYCWTNRITTGCRMVAQNRYHTPTSKTVVSGYTGLGITFTTMSENMLSTIWLIEWILAHKWIQQCIIIELEEMWTLLLKPL